MATNKIYKQIYFKGRRLCKHRTTDILNKKVFILSILTKIITHKI